MLHNEACKANGEVMADDEPSAKKDSFDGLTRAQLITLLRKQEHAKKLGLVWERDAIAHDSALNSSFAAARLIADQCERPAPWENLIIEGDNFDALRWLRMAYRGKVKCIYIDPPYNTGNKDWVYNDDYVDKTDRYRHSTWLEFLYQRFLIARDLMAEDGVMLISINDENRARLELMADEALPGMRVGSLVWRTKDTANDADFNFSSVHEHVLIYGNIDFSFLGYLLDDTKYSNPDDDPRGKYASNPITQPKTRHQRENGYYPIQDPETGWWYPCNPNSVWRYASEKIAAPEQNLRTETIETLIRDSRIIFPAKESVTYNSKKALLDAIRSGTAPVDGKKRPLLSEDLPDLDFWIGKPIGLGRPSKKLFWDEKDRKIKPVGSYVLGGKEIFDEALWELRTGKQGTATDEITTIFGSKIFDYPKPTPLIRSILEATVGPGDLVLDFFAGSATTAQAVMELNAEDGGTRRFIMVSATEATKDEPDKNLCRDVTAERIRRLNANEDKYADLSAGFAYLRMETSDTLFIDDAITPAAAWNTLEAMHDLPLTEWTDGAAHAVHAAEHVTLALVDRLDETFTAALTKARTSAPVFVYAFAPGQVVRLGLPDVEIRDVRETLEKRFFQ